MISRHHIVTLFEMKKIKTVRQHRGECALHAEGRARIGIVVIESRHRKKNDRLRRTGPKQSALQGVVEPGAALTSKHERANSPAGIALLIIQFDIHSILNI